MPDPEASVLRRSVFGFDSAWTDKPKAPGAISIIRFVGKEASFVAPTLVSFDQALGIIHAENDRSDVCLVALDQPTIVPNLTSLRPVDRVAASIISWAGGGVQAANRSRIGMFDDAAPIWRFKEALGATEEPEVARSATTGLFLIEVFPALALLSIDERFHGRLKAPRYNPARGKTFKLSDWLTVLDAAATYARQAKMDDVATWCEAQPIHAPRKADQDKLDSVICALVGCSWLLGPRSESIMIGDLLSGYMIAPASAAVRERIQAAGDRYGTMIT